MERGINLLKEGFQLATPPTIEQMYDNRFLPPVADRKLRIGLTRRAPASPQLRDAVARHHRARRAVAGGGGALRDGRFVLPAPSAIPTHSSNIANRSWITRCSP